MSNKTFVYIIDDDEQVCRAITLLINSVGLNAQHYYCVDDYLKQFNPDYLGCIIADVRMPGMSGIDLQKYFIKQAYYHPPIIIISGHGDIDMAVKAMKLGVFDFIEKPFNNQQMIDTVHRALAFDCEQKGIASAKDLAQLCYQRLTQRERQVMQAVISGKLNKVIAYEMNISQSTVEVHRAKVMSKMQANNLSDLMRLAFLLGKTLV